MRANADVPFFIAIVSYFLELKTVSLILFFAYLRKK